MRTWKAAALSSATVALLILAGLVATSQPATAALGSNWYASAPYVMPEDNSPPDVAAVMDATGQKAFQLAFILADGGCTPSWGGTSPISSDTAAGALINTIRGKGGDVSVSIGGYGGTKLGETCGSPTATAAAYQQVISKYGLKAVDFDLEEPEYENDAAVNNELGAAQILQRNNSGLYVSVTMPGTTSGTGWFGTQLLDKSKTLGFTPDNFSIMPFDGGFNGGSSQVAALESFHGLLESHLGWSSSVAYAHEGASLMNGRSDAGEYFQLSDFQTVLDYATGHGLARFTFWAVNRDRQCSPPDNNGQTSGVCSSVPQNSWDFTKFSARFAGATPPTTQPTASPSASPTSGPPGACSAAAWSATTTYNGNAVVSYNSHTWHAKWWTYGDIPGGPAGVWADDGPC
jgi:chitinase